MNKKNITCIIGTRPEAIKMAPVILALKNENEFNIKTLSTGQHTEMTAQALKDFEIIPDIDLKIMKDRQSLDYITSEVLKGVGKFLDENNQDLILVHGDTSTTFAAALAGFYRKIPVGHVEAGLRSHNKYLPFPEEINRILTDDIATLFFAPTEGTAQNLLNEGRNQEKIFITGNTVIDALFKILEKNIKSSLNLKSPLILLTAHRRESWGEALKNICAAVEDIIKARSDVNFLIPLHKNPIVRNVIQESLKIYQDNIIFTEPLNYIDFVYAMNFCNFILSDSGGIQEEASALNKPVLIMRELSERPEAISQGTGILVGTNREKIRDIALKLLNDPDNLINITRKNIKPFGNGQAAQKITGIIKNFWR